MSQFGKPSRLFWFPSAGLRYREFQLGLRATFELHSHDSDTGTGTVRTGYVWINESHHAWTPGFIQLEAEGLIK